MRGFTHIFVCQALKPFLGYPAREATRQRFYPAKSVMRHRRRPFGIGDAICSIVEDLIALPIALAFCAAMAAAFATAWEAAQAYDDLFITGPVAKQIHVGDVVIVTGRWTWDAGHSGHTELHAVKTIQKLMHTPANCRRRFAHPQCRIPRTIHRSRCNSPAVTSEIQATVDRWSSGTRAPPPPDPQHPGGLSGAQLVAMSPEQVEVYARQRRPETPGSSTR